MVSNLKLQVETFLLVTFTKINDSGVTVAGYQCQNRMRGILPSRHPLIQEMYYGKKGAPASSVYSGAFVFGG